MAADEQNPLTTQDYRDALELHQDLQNIDWQWFYSDDYNLRDREYARQYHAEDRLDSFAARGPQHAKLAQKLWDEACPKGVLRYRMPKMPPEKQPPVPRHRSTWEHLYRANDMGPRSKEKER